MKLGFYYHIPFSLKINKISCPSYLGLFIDSIASNLQKLVLIVHCSQGNSNQNDYTLTSKNIDIINLGKKTPAWHRFIFHSKILKKKLEKINHLDLILVRGPSPLMPFFSEYINNEKIIYYLIGDYSEVSKFKSITGLRSYVIKLFLLLLDFKIKNRLTKSNVITNSKKLFDEYSNKVKNIELIKTTTLNKNSFFFRDNTCLNNEINILYTGRLDFTKGLVELVDAFGLILKKFDNVYLNFAGWENDPKKPVEKFLKKHATDLDILNNIIFHGKKKAGFELNTIYRNCDIYVIPSYHEGFPRTIWEAMANSLPVISSNVGSIPTFLKSGKNSILINPKSAFEIEKSIIRLINDELLRKKIIFNGRKLSKKNTLEIQSKNIIKFLKVVND